MNTTPLQKAGMYLKECFHTRLFEIEDDLSTMDEDYIEELRTIKLVARMFFWDREDPEIRSLISAIEMKVNDRIIAMAEYEEGK